MKHSVKLATMKVSGAKRSEVERRVGSTVLKICNTKLFTKGLRLSCSVDWIDNTESMSFEALVTVYYLYDGAELEERHCAICRETHDLFYCNRQYNCNQCEFAAYRHRAQENERIMKNGGRSVLRTSKTND